jgi:hypothetical protein
MLKMNKLIVLIFSLVLFSKSVATAQSDVPNAKKWGIETEFVQPFVPTVHIIRIQATRTLTAPDQKRKGDLLLGAYIRPNVKHDVVEKINEYMAFVGYRQYFFKGLHLEAKSNMGYAWGTKNLIDAKDYGTPTWFWETNVGYKFDFLKKQNTNLYTIIQFGALGKIIADIGPRGGKPDNFLQGNLLLGINF